MFFLTIITFLSIKHHTISYILLLMSQYLTAVCDISHFYVCLPSVPGADRVRDQRRELAAAGQGHQALRVARTRDHRGPGKTSSFVSSLS